MGSLVFQDYPEECFHRSHFLLDGHETRCSEKENILSPLCLLVQVLVKQPEKCHPFFSGIEKIEFYLNAIFLSFISNTFSPRVSFGSSSFLCERPRAPGVGGGDGRDGRGDRDGSYDGAPDGIAHCKLDGQSSLFLGSTVEGVGSQVGFCKRFWWRTEILRISYALLLF